MSDRPDVELARRVHAGCDDAAGELFSRHHPAMLRYTRTLTTDEAIAEDLASEAFEPRCSGSGTVTSRRA